MFSLLNKKKKVLKPCVFSLFFVRCLLLTIACSINHNGKLLYLLIHAFIPNNLKKLSSRLLNCPMALFTWYRTKNFRPVEKSTLLVVQFTPNHANRMKIQKPSHPKIRTPKSRISI